ncbi:hypothetical protein D3C87_2167420 [compost metagenome]
MVEATACDQLIMRAAFGNAFVRDIRDAVAVLNGGEPMRDDEGSTPLEQFV